MIRPPGRHAQPLSPGIAADAEQRVSGFRALPDLIRELGGDPGEIVESAGLALSDLESPGNRISYAAMGRMLAEAATRTQCPHFGLLAGRMWHIADLGLVGELMRHSATVGDALRTLTVYQHLNSGGGLVFLTERADTVDIGYAIYQPGVSGVDQIQDTWLAASTNVLRELCGRGWAPGEVLLMRAKPIDVGVYRTFLQVQPRFNAEFCALRFAAHWMDKPIEAADPARLGIAEQQAATEGRGELLQQILRALRVMLLKGRHSGDDVARMLAMHRRTLNRRLEAEGTTFQHVLDTVRFEVARQLLATDISLDDIAAALGYAGVSPFMRAFRRWAGTSPGQWRHAAGRRRSPEGTPDVGSGSQGRSSTGSASRRGK